MKWDEGKKDRALRKALKAKSMGDLPYGFEHRLMGSILRDAAAKRKRGYVLGLVLVSAVSVLMVIGMVVLLRFSTFSVIDWGRFLSDLNFSLSEHHDLVESGTLFGFFFYIAFLALILLGGDAYFRRKRHGN